MPSIHPVRPVAGFEVPPIGFGVMALAMEGRPDRAQSLRTLHAALDAGVRLLDTAVNYSTTAAEMGYCEALTSEALRTWSGDADEVLVVAKGGNRRTDDLSFVPDGSRANLRWSCETSLRALGVERLDLFLLHTIDPEVPLVESMAALRELQDEGKIAHVGLSNGGRRQIAEARTVVEVCAVENQFSPLVTAAAGLLATCGDEGTPFLAWSPLGGAQRAATLGDAAPAFAAVAAARGVSAHQVALAWMLHRSPVVIPIPSARRPETILDSVAAAGLELSAEELTALEPQAP